MPDGGLLIFAVFVIGMIVAATRFHERDKALDRMLEYDKYVDWTWHRHATPLADDAIPGVVQAIMDRYGPTLQEAGFRRLGAVKGQHWEVPGETHDEFLIAFLNHDHTIDASLWIRHWERPDSDQLSHVPILESHYEDGFRLSTTNNTNQVLNANQDNEGVVWLPDVFDVNKLVKAHRKAMKNCSSRGLVRKSGDLLDMLRRDIEPDLQRRFDARELAADGNGRVRLTRRGAAAAWRRARPAHRQRMELRLRRGNMTLLGGFKNG